MAVAYEKNLKFCMLRFIYSPKKNIWFRAHANESFEVNATEEQVFFGSRQSRWGSHLMKKKLQEKRKVSFHRGNHPHLEMREIEIGCTI